MTPTKLVLLFSFLIFHFSFVLHAQDGENRVIQRLTWVGVEYTRHYEVIIEKEEVGTSSGGEYRELMREITTALFLEVPLLPGKYRCCVIAYDFLNQPGKASEWVYKEVLALHPEQDDTLSELSLSGTGTGSPVDETSVKANMFLSAAWMPSFTIYDKEDRFFGNKISLAGVIGRFGVVWPKWNFFNPGLELAVSYNFFNGPGGQVHLTDFGLNLLALRRLSVAKSEQVPMALTFRLGAGYSVHFHLNMGISFILFIKNRQNRFGLYLETGLDYSYWFTDTPSSCFRPWVGIGWRF